MEEPASIAAIRFRRAIGFVRAVEAAKNIVLGRPAHIIADEKIKQAVAVVIEECAARAQGLWEQLAAIRAAVVMKSDSRRVCNVGEAESKGRCGIHKCPDWSGCGG